jgi:hypothetical protein
VPQKRLYPLTLDDSYGAFLRRVLAPLGHLIQSKLMLGRRTVHGHCKLSHRSRRRWTQFVFAKLGDRNCDGLVEALCLDIDPMHNTIGIGERDATTRNAHSRSIAPYIRLLLPLVCRPLAGVCRKYVRLMENPKCSVRSDQFAPMPLVLTVQVLVQKAVVDRGLNLHTGEGSKNGFRLI